MPGDYSAITASALALIEAKGQPILFVEASTYSPATDGVTGTPATHAAVAVETERSAGVGSRRAAGEGRGDTSSASVTTVQLIVAASGLAYEPRANDFVYLAETQVEAVRFRIRNGEPVNPAGDPIIYTVEAER